MNQRIIDYFGEVDAEEREKILSKYRSDGNYSSPEIYVGTYRKYNNASLYGAWFSVAECDDAEEWYAVCALLHWDEEDPELMYQDYCYFPEAMYCECGIDIDEVIAYSQLDDDDKEIFEAYCGCSGKVKVSDEEWKDNYIGKFDSEYDFGYYCYENGYLGDVPESVECYLDFDKIGREMSWDCKEFNGHYWHAA